MTRINCVPPSELHDKHLRGEFFELPRVFTYVRMQLDKGIDPAKIKAPHKYTLGKGHVLFFYTRLGWLEKRLADLAAEMVFRGMKPDLDRLEGLSADIPQRLKGPWKPTPEALALNRERLAIRLAEMEARPKRPVPSHKD